MRCALGFTIGLVLPIAAFAQASTPIAGTWSLASLSEDHHGQITHPLGDKPQGQVIYGEHEELAVILLSGEREKKSGNPLTPIGPAIAYYGTYTVSSNNIAYHVTASTYPNFAGTDQKGTFTVKGDTLTLVREVTGGSEPFERGRLRTAKTHIDLAFSNCESDTQSVAIIGKSGRCVAPVVAPGRLQDRRCPSPHTSTVLVEFRSLLHQAGH